MLNHDSVSLVVCHKLIRAQYGLISPLLQQFVTLHEVHYSGTHHPRDNMQPHMSTQVAEVQDLYRAREHPPKHCNDLQPRPIPRLTARTHHTETKEKRGNTDSHNMQQGRPGHANPTKLHSLCECQSKEWRNRSNKDQVDVSANSKCHILSMRSNFRI